MQVLQKSGFLLVEYLDGLLLMASELSIRRRQGKEPEATSETHSSRLRLGLSETMLVLLFWYLDPSVTTWSSAAGAEEGRDVVGVRSTHAEGINLLSPSCADSLSGEQLSS